MTTTNYTVVSKGDIMATTTKLQKAQAEVSRLWNLMCAEEGVPVNAKFVVFTSTNSHAASYNLAVKKFFRIRSQAVS